MAGPVADPGGPVAGGDFLHLKFFRNSVIFEPLTWTEIFQIDGVRNGGFWIFKDNFYNSVIF